MKNYAHLQLVRPGFRPATPRATPSTDLSPGVRRLSEQLEQLMRHRPTAFAFVGNLVHDLLECGVETQ